MACRPVSSLRPCSVLILDINTACPLITPRAKDNSSRSATWSHIETPPRFLVAIASRVLAYISPTAPRSLLGPVAVSGGTSQSVDCMGIGTLVLSSGRYISDIHHSSSLPQCHQSHRIRDSGTRLLRCLLHRFSRAAMPN